MKVDLKTTYLGLELAHPYMVSASSLTASTEGVQKAWENGASAVVLKSLFEEQISQDMSLDTMKSDEYPHPEALDYIHQMGMRIGPRDYLGLIEASRKAVPIPVIASVNCVSGSWWTEFAQQIEASGAHALELNIGFLPTELGVSSQEIESRLFNLVAKVRSAVKIPLAVKLGNSWTSLPNVLSELTKLGIQGATLFNRFYQLDISLDSMTTKSGVAFSNDHDFYQSLRWISLLHGTMNMDFSASGGVHSAQSGLKLLSVGAKSIQLCSVLYKNGYKSLTALVKDTSQWLEEKGYGSLDEFRGSMAKIKSKDPGRYERIQYIKALTGMY